MSYVYSNATITLLASRAASVNDGFLHDRTPLDHEKQDSVFRLPYISPAGGAGSVVLVPMIDQPEEPLSRPAWAFQERVLASRILDYRSTQTRWLCHTAHKADGLAESIEYNDTVWDARAQAVSTRNSSKILTTFGQWNLVIRQCTSRELTLAEDRLPAVAGIAERMHAVSNDDYVAGLWQSTLPKSLLWYRSTSNISTTCSLGFGPSWSWASVDCPVQPYPSDAHGAVDVAKFIFVDVTLKDSNSRFGPVTSGSVTIKGPMLNGTIEDEYRTRIADNRLPTFAETTLVQNWLDKDLDSFGQNRSVHLLHIQRSEDSEWSLGLLLSGREDGRYSKVGCFRFYAMAKWGQDPNPALFASIPIATATII